MRSHSTQRGAVMPKPPPVDIDPDPKPNPNPGPANVVTTQKYSLRAANGDYLCAEFGGGVHLSANRKEVRDWETFLFEDVGDGVTIRTHSGHFVCAEPSGVVIANRTDAGAWERWEVVDLGGGGTVIALKSHHGAFLCAELGGGGAVVANRPGIGGWETFVRAEVRPLFEPLQ